MSAIKAAYYAAVKTNHPDVNAAPDAHLVMSLLNEAYAVLSNPARRARYDHVLHASDELEQHAAAQARLATLPRFAKALRVGMNVVAKEAGDLSVVLRAAWRIGRVSALERLGRLSGAVAYDTRRRMKAARRRIVRSRALAVVTSADLRMRSAAARPRRVRARNLAFAVAIPLLLIALPATVRFIGSASGAGQLHIAAVSVSSPSVEEASNARPRVQSEPTPSAVTASLPCLERDTKVSGNQLYLQCVQTRVKLHDLIINATSNADIERYRLSDAIAEINQALGASQTHLSSRTELHDESVAVFAVMKDSAKLEQVRDISRTYYNCYALNRCAR